MEGNNFINELLNEINHVRLNPKSYAKKLRMCAQSFDGDVLRLPELKNGLMKVLLLMKKQLHMLKIFLSYQ